MLRKVWEVYEENTSRCIAFATKDAAENQTVFSSVDFIYESEVVLSEDELQTLEKGLYIWCN